MPVCREYSLDLYAGSAALAKEALPAAAAALALANLRDLWPLPAAGPMPACFLEVLPLSESSITQLDSMVGVMGREVRTTSSAW